MIKQCFTSCSCGEVKEEHCISSDYHCHKCNMYFGNKEITMPETVTCCKEDDGNEGN
jgi:hypothetical protein